MQSKELLLVRLHVSGLGLEPRWLLNRLKTKTDQHKLSVHAPQIIPCQVLRKAEGVAEAERAAAVETGKAKDENEDKKKGVNAIQGASSGEVTRVWVGTGAKVAPQQVENLNCFDRHKVFMHHKSSPARF